MCSIGQLSTGAYFLRRDFFPSIVSVRLFNELRIPLIIINTFKAGEVVRNGVVNPSSHPILDYSRQLPQVRRSKDESVFETYQKFIRWRPYASTRLGFEFCSSNCHTVCRSKLHSTLSLIQFSAYQTISDDSAPTISKFSFESVVTQFRPDRVLGLMPLAVSTRDKFKVQ